VKNTKATRKITSPNAAGIPTLLLLGALSGTALAATDFQEPCPEADTRQDVLNAFIAEDAPAALVRTVDTTEPAPATPVSDADDETGPDTEETDNAATSESSAPAFTTSLPGVSVNDMPGFRRHMYRTDI
jgi:hypothetical protein